MSARALSLALGLLLLHGTGAAAQTVADPDRPRLDPFARPAIEDLPRQPGEAGDPEPAPGEGDWLPVLRGTLVASGGGSMANLGGSVLRIGEEVEGYRLIAVRSWEAEFEYEGERLVLPVEGTTP